MLANQFTESRASGGAREPSAGACLSAGRLSSDGQHQRVRKLSARPHQMIAIRRPRAQRLVT